jgi:hypothetical protein
VSSLGKREQIWLWLCLGFGSRATRKIWHKKSSTRCVMTVSNVRNKYSGGKSFAEVVHRARQFQPDEYLSSAVATGTFVQFGFNEATLNRVVLNQINSLTHLHPSGKPSYGTNTSGAGKKLVLEFSSPNIAKVTPAPFNLCADESRRRMSDTCNVFGSLSMLDT